MGFRLCFGLVFFLRDESRLRAFFFLDSLEPFGFGASFGWRLFIALRGHGRLCCIILELFFFDFLDNFFQIIPCSFSKDIKLNYEGADGFFPFGTVLLLLVEKLNEFGS